MIFRITQAGSVALLAITILALPGLAQRPEPKKTEVHGYTMYSVLKPGDIAAIFEPSFIPVSAAGDLYYDDEPLLVVAGGGKTKAYSTWHLDHHEVVNDYINGVAIAATW